MPIHKKVAVAVSGGVDSCFAAYLLHRRYDITGITFRTSFLSPRNIERASYICRKLGIPHEVVDIDDTFRKEVIDYFVSSYLEGVTPNPCAVCNRKIKFGFLYEAAKRKGCSYLATGHYARIIKEGNEWFLAMNNKGKKSQEYFLALVDKNIFKNVIFPLAGYEKKEVVAQIKRTGIYPFPIKESQEICFVRGEKYGDFVSGHIKNKGKYTGFIRYRDGSILGRHRGAHLFTYGQREGLGISWRKPLYVVDIDASVGDVVVAEKEFAFKSHFFVRDLNWFYSPHSYDDLCVRVRYNSRLLPCRIKVVDKEEVKCIFKQDREIPAPGQVAVFYEGDRVVAGGIIARDKRGQIE